MKKASEYRRHAEECHALAKGMTGEQRDQLLEMAATWERLAEDRAALVKGHPELAVDGEAEEESLASAKPNR
jgi:glutamine synthetase adenylyltransferase